MLAHNIKAILATVPEVTGMVKQANLEEDFPVDSKDSVVASYLRVHYLTKVAERFVDPAVEKRITKAAKLYEVKDELDKYVGRFSVLEKKAAENQEKYGLTLREVEAGFEGDLAGFGFLGIEKTASMANAIYEKYGDQVKSEAVLRYAGRRWLNKEAAVLALANRYHVSKEPAFVKIARLVHDSIRESDFDAISSICKTVQGLDKQAGLDVIGFNFYKEALYGKEAELKSALTVKLAGKDVPWECIEKFGKARIENALGKDVANALTGDAATDKAMLESLPLDSQKLLCKLVESC